MKGSPVLIRYADDFVVHCHSRQEAIEVKARLAAWLAPRGLAFNDDKTQVVSLGEGYDFLGFNVRRYRRKLLIKPSKAAVRRIRERLRTELRSLRGSNAPAVLKRLNPIIRGWAAYYRTQVSAETFGAGLLPVAAHTASGPRSATRTSRRTGCSPGTSASSTRPGRTGGCSVTAHSGAYLHRFAWTNIVRHQIVRHGASPDDPALADYWAWRRRKAPLPINRTALWLHRSKTAAARSARATLVAVEDRPQTPHQWETWLATTRKTIDIVWDPGTPDKAGPPRLIHLRCNPHPPAIRARLSRMLGNGHVRF